MKHFLIFFLLFFTAMNIVAGGRSVKPRVIVLTDIENEPDDAMSMVRFLTYSNQWDVEGLIATTSVHQKNKLATWRIREIVEAYGKVQPNLLKHEPGFPEVGYLQSIVKEGRADYGMRAVGEGNDSEGSEWIIKMVDRSDDRPVWVIVWGGPNCLAQALWKVKNTRSAEELEYFVSKLRVYAISDQDDSGPWLRSTFRNLFYIVSPGFHRFGGYHYGTWSGISGDNFHGRFSGANSSIVENPWLDEHIRCKGPLGEQYPFMKFLMEGDTPSFLYLIDNGLGNPERPDWGSWGGRYELYQPRTERWFLQPETRPIWTNAMDEVMGIDGRWYTGNKETIWRWREAFQNDFEARMDWTIKDYRSANHPPVVRLSSDSIIIAHVGDTIQLSAENSSDPDGNKLSFNWFYYQEPGTMNISSARTGNPLKIESANDGKALLVVPKTERFGTMHVIVAVSDDGKPSLTRYGRVIIDVRPRHENPVKPRIIVSTDIGGTDPDDNQSMAHLLMYNDCFDIEGLISSPAFGKGSKEEILRMIDLYAKDYTKLKKHARGLLTPDSLKTLCKQGRRGLMNYQGYGEPTEGSEWIVRQARKYNDRPLWILVWGSLEDVAQALHDAPDILPRIRVYYIGGPNKKWGVNSYAYIAENFPDLWMIENNATYRGFISDNKKQDRYNKGYYNYAILGAGALGEDFQKYYDGIVKMGDTPSLLYAMDGNLNDPTICNWGGQFRSTRHTSRHIMNHPVSKSDTIHIYSVAEFRFRGPKVQIPRGSVCFNVIIDKQTWDGYYLGDGNYGFRYSPKQIAVLTYKTISKIKELNNLTGSFVVDNMWPGNRTADDYSLGNNWYTDSSDPSLSYKTYHGAQSILKWRNKVLDDWKLRWDWLRSVP